MSTPQRGWLTEDQQKIWRNSLLAKTRMSEYLDHVLRQYGLSLEEYELLVRLSEAPDTTLRMGELAESVRHSRSRLTHTIARMEKRNLVRREPTASDGRGVQAVLTAEGFDVLRAAAPHHVDSVREVLIDAVSADDLAAFGRCMEAILKAADEATGNR